MGFVQTRPIEASNEAFGSNPVAIARARVPESGASSVKREVREQACWRVHHASGGCVEAERS
jgi:hypothetical protein